MRYRVVKTKVPIRSKYPVLFSILVLLGILGFSTPASAYNFNLTEIGVNVYIPYEYKTLTRDMSSYDSRYFSEDASQLKNDMIADSAYLYAWDELFITEIIVRAVDISDDTAQNMNELSVQEIEQVAKSFIPQIEKAYACEIASSTVYTHKQVRFIEMLYSFRYDGSTVYGKWYYTVCDGIGINIMLHSYDGELTNKEIETIDQIVESAHFANVPDTTPPEAVLDRSDNSSIDIGTSDTQPANSQAVNPRGRFETGLSGAVQGALLGGIAVSIGFIIRAVKKRFNKKSTTQADQSQLLNYQVESQYQEGVGRTSDEEEATQNRAPAVSSTLTASTIARNIVFALVGFVAVGLFFGLLTLAYKSIVAWVVLNWILSIDSVLWLLAWLICLLVLIVIMQLLGLLFSLLYTAIMYIAKSAKLSYTWTSISLIINIVLAGIYFWPGYIEIGSFLSITAGIALTASFIWLGAAIDGGAAEIARGRIMDEAYAGDYDSAE